MSLCENMMTTYQDVPRYATTESKSFSVMMIITANRFITVIYQKTHHPDGKSMKTALTEYANRIPTQMPTSLKETNNPRLS